MANKGSNSRAFFLELILDLVVFAICAIVSIQVFFEAQILREKSSALSHLTIQTQVIAETFKASDGDPFAMLKALDSRDVTSITELRDQILLVTYYDSDFAPTSDSEHSRYRIECLIDNSKDLKVAEISILDREKEMFTVEVKDFVPASSARGGG